MVSASLTPANNSTTHHELTMDNQPHTLMNTQPSANGNSLDTKTIIFTGLIVELVTGLPISYLPAEKRDEIVEEALSIYLEFMKSFLEETKGKRTALQYKIFESNGDLGMLAKFHDLDEGLKEAHEAFLNTVINA